MKMQRLRPCGAVAEVAICAFVIGVATMMLVGVARADSMQIDPASPANLVDVTAERSVQSETVVLTNDNSQVQVKGIFPVHFAGLPQFDIRSVLKKNGEVIDSQRVDLGPDVLLVRLVGPDFLFVAKYASDGSDTLIVRHVWKTEVSTTDEWFGSIKVRDSMTNELVYKVSATLGTEPDDASKLVFVTQEAFTGNLGGLAGADAKCQAAADAAGHTANGETFKAWLSVLPLGDDDPRRRFSDRARDENPFVLVDGTVVADGWTDLVDGDIDAPIVLTEHGLEAEARVWTATEPEGYYVPGASDCAAWTREDVNWTGEWGLCTLTGPGWSWLSLTHGPDLCSSSNRLYCFEQ